MSELMKRYGIEVKKGEYIFKEGDTADSMYLIHKGKVQISKDVVSGERKLVTLSEGQFIGEMAIINSTSRSANALAVEDCELIKMDKHSFDHSVRENHELAVSVIKLLSDRLRETTDALPVLTEKNIQQMYEIDILREILANGKKDQAGKFQLVKMEPVVEKLKKKYPKYSHRAEEIINGILNQNNITQKKDGNDISWLAYPLE